MQSQTGNGITGFHVFLSPIRNESRFLKEAKTSIYHGIVEQVVVVGLGEETDEEYQQLGDRIFVWRIKLRTRRWPKNVAMQLLKFVEWTLRILFYAGSFRIAFVQTHSLSALPVGVILKLFRSYPLVYDAHELETEVEETKGMRKKLAKYVEKYFIKYVDATIVVSNEIRNWYINSYQLKSIETVMNCPNFTQKSKSTLLRDEFKINDQQYIVIYQGGLSEDRGIKLLIDAFENKMSQKFVLILMGYGELKTYVMEKAARNKNIIFKDAVKPSEVLNYTSSADIGVHWIDGSCMNHQFCLPNKLFEYMMAGLPVAVSNLPEMKGLIRKHKVGVIIENWAPESLEIALQKIIEMKPEEISNNVEAASKIFNWESQEIKYVHLLRKIIH